MTRKEKNNIYIYIYIYINKDNIILVKTYFRERNYPSFYSHFI